MIWLVSQTVIPHMEWVDGGFTVSVPENYVAKYNYIPFAAISDALYKIFADKSFIKHWIYLDIISLNGNKICVAYTA